MENYNAKRLESRILEAVNTLIVNGDIKNPYLSRFANATDIELSRDNSFARIYVSCLEDNRLEKSVAALQSASGFIQARLAKILKTRNTPKLVFEADTTQREASRVNDLLESLKK